MRKLNKKITKKKLPEYPDGGKTPPNFNDSLALYNSSKALKDYYSPDKGYEEFNNYPIKYEDWNNTNLNSLINYNPLNHTTQEGTKKNVPLGNYYQKINDNQYKQRENSNYIMDLNAPMTLYDRRINPQFHKTYQNKNKGILENDMVDLYNYDPIAVKPWSLMNEIEKKERLKKYGTKGTPIGIPKKSVLRKEAGVDTKFVNTKKVVNKSIEKASNNQYYGVNIKNGIPQPIESTLEKQLVFDPGLAGLPSPQVQPTQINKTTTSRQVAKGYGLYDQQGNIIMREGLPVVPAQYQYPGGREIYYKSIGLDSSGRPTGNINTYVNGQLPKQANGGLFNGRILDGLQDLNSEKIKTGLGNTTKLIGDTALSSLGMSNIIQDDAYKGNSANEFADTSKITGTVGSAVLPMAANAILPGSGQFIKMGQKGLNLINSSYGGDEQGNGDEFAQGGMYQGQANAEVEKQEVMQMPNGTTEQVDGASHENGGVPVNLPQSTRIFSDRLKLKGKTFAKLASKYKTDKEEKILSDTNSNNILKKTAQLNMENKNRKLDEIFNIQESMKAKRINSYIKKYGGTQKYPNGGLTFGDPNEMNNYYNNIQNMSLVNPTNGLEYENPIDPGLAGLNPTPAPLNPGGLAKGAGSMENNKSGLSEFYNDNKDTINKIGTEVGIGALNNIGNLAYLAQQGKKYDTVDYGKVTPNYLTDEASQRAISEGYSTGAYNLRNSGQQTQAGQIALANNRMRQSADSKERISNINTQIGNQAAYANQGYKMQGMNDEAANKAAAQTSYYSALGAVGQNAAMQRGDYLNKQMDQKKLALIKDYFPDYQFDSKTFQYMYNKAKQAKG